MLIDGRGMSPPEPLERTLAALATIAADEELVLLLYCQPHPLYKLLRAEGHVWQEQLLEDGTREIRIRRARPAP